MTLLTRLIKKFRAVSKSGICSISCIKTSSNSERSMNPLPSLSCVIAAAYSIAAAAELRVQQDHTRAALDITAAANIRMRWSLSSRMCTSSPSKVPGTSTKMVCAFKPPRARGIRGREAYLVHSGKKDELYQLAASGS